MSIPSDSVGLDLDKGEAFFCLSDAQMPDMGNLLTALWGGGALDGEGLPLLPVFPSTVSLEARWFDAGPIEELRDEVNQFSYLHRKTSASIQWRSIRRGARYETDDGSQTVNFAAIGQETKGDFLV